ncbi:MAG: DUF4961 domain-containing protein, partial [Ferruginibacter sp.]
MKYFKTKKIQNYLVRILATMIVMIIISCSMTIDTIVQPSSVNGGDILPVTLNVTVKTNSGQTSKLMIAVLVPKLWKIAQKGTATFTSDISTGAQQMTIVPAGAAAPNGNGLNWPTYLATKIGNGGNLINDSMSVTLRLTEDIDVSRGDVICRPANHPEVGQDIDAMV